MKATLDPEQDVLDDIEVRVRAPSWPFNTQASGAIAPERKESLHHSDPHLAGAVREAIDLITTIPVEQLRVTVASGHVVLAGMVESGSQRQTIEETVRNLAGVRRVTNHIVVQPEPSCGEAPPIGEAGFDQRLFWQPDMRQEAGPGLWIAIVAILLLCAATGYVFWAKIADAWPF